MRQFKIIGVIAVGSYFVTLLLYCWRHSFRTRDVGLPKLIPEVIPDDKPINVIGTPMRHMPLDVIYKDLIKIQNSHDGQDSFELDDRPEDMIDNIGCTIPMYSLDYNKNANKSRHSRLCGKRAVFFKKTKEDHVQAMIKSKAMKKYLRKSAVFDCCYRFISRSTQPGQETSKIQYTTCTKFKNDETISLLSDFINVKCFEYDKRNVSRAIYEDVYGFTKKINTSKSDEVPCKYKYNVLMLGMDSMSLPRLVKTMPRTFKFLQDNLFVTFRGYHKVGDNTFPNLMAAFTGLNISTLDDNCTDKMDQCNNLLMWSRFKESGYVTAYGEDYLSLPDVFSNDYAFKKPPTDHYLRTLYIKRETFLNNKSLVCTGKVSSGKQLLDYALDFTLTYKKESFFGLFWMNSFSHNINSRPQDADTMFENFLNQIFYTGITENTFIIFFSDHGLRFGEERFKPASFYDERLPFLEIYAPTLFKARQPFKVGALVYNSMKLITPYDLYNTLEEINHISQCRNLTNGVSEACPKCQSIFNMISTNRTCQDITIHDKWCSCHKLFPLDEQDVEGGKSVNELVSYIKTRIDSIKTKQCWACKNLSLQKVVRIHFYYQNHMLYHVVAITMNPGNMSYEATVLRKGDKMEIIGTISVISPYGGGARCAIRRRDRVFCMCQKVKNCRLSN